MDTFTLFSKFLIELVLKSIFFFLRKVLFLYIGNFSSDVRHHEEVFIFPLGHLIDSLISEFYLVVFLVDNKK